ncbi:MAG: hypothetical protein R3F31_11585 [Verrucomicrobiales bacterium]
MLPLDAANRGALWNLASAGLPGHEAQPPRRAKKAAPGGPGNPSKLRRQTGCGPWSFMHDTLYHGKRFRTLNVFDEGVREILAIEVDSTSLAGRTRSSGVLEQIKESRTLPSQIRVDNGPELISKSWWPGASCTESGSTTSNP